ncbi:MAG: putative rane protein [Myxococcales bacterium]|nr:putative rane protein [Myxococcales bacterium]
MPVVIPPFEAKLTKIFRRIVAHRRLIMVIYALLLPPSVWLALQVQQDNSLDRLVVQSDPTYAANKRFEEVFGHGEYVLVLAEADDPFAPETLKKFNELEEAVSKVPRVTANSAVSVFRRVKGGFDASPAAAEAFKKFVTGSELFKKQGLVGEHMLALPLFLDVRTGEQRTQVIEGIDAALAPFEKNPAPLKAIRKVGQPYVNAYLDNDTRTSGYKYFPLFMLFVIVLNWVLYRSFRALGAFVLTLGVCAAMTVGFVGLTGGTFTIVSSLVPMTILITTTATLVYLHSRYVEVDKDVTDIDEHQARALANKFVAATASIFATAVGFAALAVSEIRPIRELGLWVAAGLVLTWITVFTLFPALQKALNTPTEKERKTAGQWFVNFVMWLPPWSYRWRWILVPGSLILCGVGAIMLFGFPGVLKPMTLETNALEYIPHDSALYKDTKRLEEQIAGLSITEVWLRGKPGEISDAPVLRGLQHFSDALEADKHIGTVIGPTVMLRTLRYVSGQGDKLPEDDESLEAIGGTLETLLPKEPMLQSFVDKKLAQTHLSVITKTVDYQGFVELDKTIRDKWQEAVRKDPVLKDFEMEIVGLAPLQAKISKLLVPTLTHSFALTVVIIFGTFLLVFRSGAARLMAMIPSLFAILVMFAVMRLSHMSLNVATILIASTVLGTSENDQIHFFYHFQEARNAGQTTEQALRHTLGIAGRAIFFATIINAGGFLAFAFSTLPPVRQFGILSAIAFLLSMLADFTALPAALWMVFRERPDKVNAARSAEKAKLR